jgi:hypothetical protein
MTRSRFHGLRDAQSRVAPPVATFRGPGGAEGQEAKRGSERCRGAGEDAASKRPPGAEGPGGRGETASAPPGRKRMRRKRARGSPFHGFRSGRLAATGAPPVATARGPGGAEGEKVQRGRAVEKERGKRGPHLQAAPVGPKSEGHGARVPPPRGGGGRGTGTTSAPPGRKRLRRKRTRGSPFHGLRDAQSRVAPPVATARGPGGAEGEKVQRGGAVEKQRGKRGLHLQAAPVGPRAPGDGGRLPPPLWGGEHDTITLPRVARRSEPRRSTRGYIPRPRWGRRREGA